MKSFKIFMIYALISLFASEMIYDFIKIYSNQSLNIAVFDDSETKETEKDDDVEKDKLNSRFLNFSSLNFINSITNNFIISDFFLFTNPQLEINTPPPDYYSA
jgi:hypothetical protein